VSSHFIVGAYYAARFLTIQFKNPFPPPGAVPPNGSTIKTWGWPWIRQHPDQDHCGSTPNNRSRFPWRSVV